MIEVILLERIHGLGQLGQVVKVRPGYARNLLLPTKKALRATKANLELFEKQRIELEAQNATRRTHAEEVAKKIEGLKLVIIRQASETGQLFGSVSARDVSMVAKEAGHEIEKNQVQIDMPIKELGLFPVKVNLHPEVSLKITVNVARTVEEAAVQVEKAATAATKKAKAVAVAEAEALEAAAVGVEAPAAEPKAEKKAEKKASKKTEKVDEEKPAKAKKPRAKKAD